MPKWNTYYKPGIYEIIFTSFRNRIGYYLDNNINIKVEDLPYYAREVDKEIQRIMKTRDIPVNELINEIEKQIKYTESKYASRSNNSLTTKEAL